MFNLTSNCPNWVALTGEIHKYKMRTLNWFIYNNIIMRILSLLTNCLAQHQLWLRLWLVVTFDTVRLGFLIEFKEIYTVFNFFKKPDSINLMYF